MTDKNLTAVLHAPGDIRLQDAEVPEPNAGQVQIRIENVGICGSDLSMWEHGDLRECWETKAPFAPGHESAGVVSKLGDGVTTLKVGDNVALDPMFPCGHCMDCKTGRCNLCPKIVFCGHPDHSGYMTRYFVQNAEHCFRLPSHVSLEEGAMIQPLAVVLHACRRAGVLAGNKVLICGAGPIGLLTLLVARVFGASSICVTEIRENRIQMAKKLGADYTLNVTSKDPQDVADMVEKFFGEKPNIAIECSGAESSTQTAVYATRSGGRMTQVGLGKASIIFPIISATAREVDIVGIMSNAYCTPLAVELVASGQIDVKPVITRRYDLEDVATAFKFAELREGGKVMVRCSKS